MNSVANYGLVIYSDNTYLAMRTDASPGVSDSYDRDSGAILVVVMPYYWVQQFKLTLTFIPYGWDQESELVYKAAMAWIYGDTLSPDKDRFIRSEYTYRYIRGE